MSTLQTLTAMCLIGYLGFVFISESFNPFKKAHISELRSRKKFGVLIGALLAASGAMAFIVQTQTFLAKFKASLGVATIIVAVAVIAVAIRQFFGWIAHRRRNKAAKMLADQNTPATDKKGISGQIVEPVSVASKEDLVPVMAKDSRTDNVVSVGAASDIVQVDTQPALYKKDEISNDSAYASDQLIEGTENKTVDEAVTGELVIDRADAVDTQQVDVSRHDRYEEEVATKSDAMTPVDQTVNHNDDHDNDLLIEQTATATSQHNELHVEDRFFGTGPIDATEGTAANHNLFEDYTPPGSDVHPANDDNLVVADDLFDDIAEVTEVAEVPNVVVLEEQDASAAKWPEVVGDEIPNGDAILNLKSAMQAASNDAVQIQDSVNQINTLNRKEAYYRSRVEQAQAAYEQAQLAQHESQTVELELGERRLEQEIESRLTIENQLERKLAELDKTQSRVRTLQADLHERQQIFSDQVSSLEKTKAMARDAALLARRAAMAQQKARTEALKERAARERLEVSAKKAVHIARSAISKLAEEERRNRN